MTGQSYIVGGHRFGGWEAARPRVLVVAGRAPTNRREKRMRCKARRRARLALDKIFRRVDAIEPCTGPVEVVSGPRPKIPMARWSAFEDRARAEQTDHLRKIFAAHEKEKRAARGEVDESAEFEAVRVRVRELIAAWRERDGAEVEP